MTAPMVVKLAKGRRIGSVDDGVTFDQAKNVGDFQVQLLPRCSGQWRQPIYGCRLQRSHAGLTSKAERPLVIRGVTAARGAAVMNRRLSQGTMSPTVATVEGPKTF